MNMCSIFSLWMGVSVTLWRTDVPPFPCSGIFKLQFTNNCWNVMSCTLLDSRLQTWWLHEKRCLAVQEVRCLFRCGREQLSVPSHRKVVCLLPSRIQCSQHSYRQDSRLKERVRDSRLYRNQQQGHTKAWKQCKHCNLCIHAHIHLLHCNDVVPRRSLLRKTSKTVCCWRHCLLLLRHSLFYRLGFVDLIL